jgi:tripartite-type tricarboxylate transporter receptor subunit TctC
MGLLSNNRQILSRATGAFLAVALTAMAPQSAQAQMPRTIRIVVPFPAGGPTDVTARVLGEQIGKLHDVSFVIENRPGGGALIATEAVARAEPDGGTLLIVAAGVLINPLLKKTNCARRTTSWSTRSRRSATSRVSSPRRAPNRAS